MTDTDRRYVVPTWAQSARYPRLSKAQRFRLVDVVLSRARVSVLASDARTVHAWACSSDDVLHYAYVPPELRGHGLARRAIEHVMGAYPDRVVVSHRWPYESSRYRHDPDMLLREIL